MLTERDRRLIKKALSSDETPRCLRRALAALLIEACECTGIGANVNITCRDLALAGGTVESIALETRRE